MASPAAKSKIDLSPLGRFSLGVSARPSFPRHTPGTRLLGRQNQLIARNSVDLVVHMRRDRQGLEGYDEDRALEWLRDQFGGGRAAGAAFAHREQYALEFFGRLREDRERERALVPERGDDPWLGPQGRAEEHDRGSHDRGGGPERGGGGHSFSR